MLHSPEIFNADLPSGFDEIFEWDFLSEAFRHATGRNIQPTDIDAFIEINGNFLAVEKKRLGVDIPVGQNKALEALWSIGYCLLIKVWVNYNGSVERFIIHYPSGRVADVHKANNRDLKIVAYLWARWADRGVNNIPFIYEQST